MVLMLLQLNREKANLVRWREYFHKMIKKTNSDAEIEGYRKELADVVTNLKLTEPMVNFLQKELSMGDVFAGDDMMFATEYRRHLLDPREYTPPRENIDFFRRQEEHQVAKTLNRIDLEDGHLRSLSRPDSTSTSQFLKNLPENPTYRERRLQLEKELSTLDSIAQPCVEKRSRISQILRQGHLPTVPFRQESRGSLAPRRDSRTPTLELDDSIQLPVKASTVKQQRNDDQGDYLDPWDLKRKSNCRLPTSPPRESPIVAREVDRGQKTGVERVKLAPEEVEIPAIDSDSGTLRPTKKPRSPAIEETPLMATSAPMVRGELPTLWRTRNQDLLTQELEVGANPGPGDSGPDTSDISALFETLFLQFSQPDPMDIGNQSRYSDLFSSADEDRTLQFNSGQREMEENDRETRLEHIRNMIMKNSFISECEPNTSRLPRIDLEKEPEFALRLNLLQQHHIIAKQAAQSAILQASQ
ncbi:hypothetical protein Ciccas_008160 [Cichlidogyrus casuarinus]|uniref:Uncharacterized protein n=1 Tax=Cichlidogyrus casuarinus TaxID=1844966 RepID=A0ABD2Q264_9PLAT